MTPAAIGKAESLRRFAQMTGAPLREFKLIATLGEGYELLDYLADGGLGRFACHDQLVADIAEAKAKSDPWIVLQHFQLQGLDIVRADKVLQ